MKISLLLVFLFSIPLCYGEDDPRLKNASREEHGGWIYLHLEGTPGEVGFQHGFLLSDEIDDALKMFAYYLKGNTQKDWTFYREAAQRMYWPKLDKEYQEEIAGIAEGLRAKGKQYDKIDITAMNGWMELAWYYLPALAEKEKAGSGNNKAPGNCSAFIATGHYTEDGQIVMGHNSWVEYIVGERWNIIADIVPAKGHHILMDSFPGFIHSGDDFAVNDAGILNTETTITQFKGFDETGIPEFMRARKATQYAESIDDFVRIMTDGNNGGYANTWLVGDIRKNEIGKLDLGLKHHRLWRTNDGVFVGSNFGTDSAMVAEETTFDTNDRTNSPNARKIRWEQIVEQKKGSVNLEVAKMFEGDHIDALEGKVENNRCVICGHIDEDPHGAPEFGWGAYYPAGSVNGKVTTAALARQMKIWARMGHPCGQDFIAAPYFKAHPEYAWQAKFLHDMKSGEWTMFAGKP